VRLRADAAVCSADHEIEQFENRFQWVEGYRQAIGNMDARLLDNRRPGNSWRRSWSPRAARLPTATPVPCHRALRRSSATRPNLSERPDRAKTGFILESQRVEVSFSYGRT
jgi:hypothetical protein